MTYSDGLDFDSIVNDEVAMRGTEKVIVVDVESTCWDHNTVPKGQAPEIIEIGIAMVDFMKGAIYGNCSIFVKPIHSDVSKFCTELTGITPEMLDKSAIGFESACETLRLAYGGKHNIWGSYGDYDRRMFQRQCMKRGIKYPFGSRHINIKTLHALHRGLRTEVGMDEALKQAGLELKGQHHSGKDDALNIARILYWHLDGMVEEHNG